MNADAMGANVKSSGPQTIHLAPAAAFLVGVFASLTANSVRFAAVVVAPVKDTKN